jgi:hypothetical protein
MRRTKLKSTIATPDKSSASDDTKPIIAPGTLGEQLLYSREAAQHLLGDISLATIKRMEDSGRLNPIRPTGAATGKVFYSGANLIAVTRGGAS